MPKRRLLALACLALAACAQDGPPVATRASSLAPAEQDEVVELAAAATSTVAAGVEAGVDDGAVETLSTPTSEPDDRDDDGDDESDAHDNGAEVGEGLGASDVPRPMPDTVAVVGDSIARSAQPYLVPALESLGIDVVAYDALESRRMINGGSAIPSGRSAIRDVLDDGEEPDLWVIALGTNDVGAATGPEAWASAVDDVMDEIPNDADVMWVDTWLRRLDPATVEFNDTLRNELRRHADTLVLDWHARAAEDGLIIEDGVHLTEAGRIEYARLVTDAIADTYD